MGNINAKGLLGRIDKDHPHLREENITYLCILETPPLAWGKQLRKKKPSIFRRITPTSVGNTTFGPMALNLSRDHPHCREEYVEWQNSRDKRLGAPPLKWGILNINVNWSNAIRITPTAVGNKPPIGTIGISLKDHPHCCGKY